MSDELHKLYVLVLESKVDAGKRLCYDFFSWTTRKNQFYRIEAAKLIILYLSLQIQ